MINLAIHIISTTQASIVAPNYWIIPGSQADHNQRLHWLTPPRGQSGSSRTPNESPRDLKGSPRDSQGVSSESQGAKLDPQGSPKDPQGPLWRTPEELFWGPWAHTQLFKDSWTNHYFVFSARATFCGFRGVPKHGGPSKSDFWGGGTSIHSFVSFLHFCEKV